MSDIILQLDEIETNNENPHIAHVCGKASETIEALRTQNVVILEFMETQRKIMREKADTIEALRAENARLREALKPFADLYDADDGDDDCYPILNSDLRAARAAVGESD